MANESYPPQTADLRERRAWFDEQEKAHNAEVARREKERLARAAQEERERARDQADVQVDPRTARQPGPGGVLRDYLQTGRRLFR